ncbi:MAG: DinB family protein [Rhodothermales bacterium]
MTLNLKNRIRNLVRHQTDADLETEILRLAESYRRYCDGLNDEHLSSDCTYTNSAGASFSTPVADVLLHVFMHGMYHRGRINLLIRQAGGDPAPADYIAFVRGAAAATHPTR